MEFVRMKKIYVMVAVVVMSSFAFAETPNYHQINPIRHANTSSKETLPADVLARAKLLEANVRQLIKVVGKSQHIHLFYTADNAIPRDVYIEAVLIFKKVNRLAYEYTGLLEEEPTIPLHIAPSNVFQIINLSLDRISAINRTLNLTDITKEVAEPESTKPTAVYNALNKIEFLLENLSPQTISASEVYRNITQAVYYAGKILTEFPNTAPIPDEPILKKHISEAEVYSALKQCFEMTEKIGQASDRKTLNVTFNSVEEKNINISHLEDMANLILTNLNYFYYLAGITRTIPSAYYPGIRTASQLLQRTELLQLQLNLIYERTKNDKSWIKENSQERQKYRVDGK